VCACAPGYAGLYCDKKSTGVVPADACAGHICQNGGVCVNKQQGPVLGPVCYCLPGFSGAKCELELNECSSDPCLNDAVCIDSVAGYYCICPLGMTGGHCETDIDECASFPCDYSQPCVNGPASYTCNCGKFYTGKNCETPVVPLEVGPINSPVIGALKDHASHLSGLGAVTVMLSALAVLRNSWFTL
jgi:hypothetical protein